MTARLSLHSFHRLTLGSALVLSSALVLNTACQTSPAKKNAAFEVSVVKVEPQDVTIYTDFVGSIDGIENAEIRARVAGYLEKVHFTEGTRVKAGELLMTIDPVLSEAEVRKARGDVAMAQAGAAKSRADVQRLTPLVATNSVSRQELDHATAEQQSAEAQILAYQGALATAQASLDFTQVRSPIDGVVGVRNVSVGTLVGQSEPTLLTTVSNLDPVRVRFPVSEQLYLKHAAALNSLVDRPGISDEPVSSDNNVNKDTAKKDDKGATQGNVQKAEPTPARPRLQLELILADGSVYPEQGWLALIDRAISISTGSILLEARFPNPKGILRPGQFGRVRAATEKVAGALAVPQRAVMERQSMHEVFVITDKNEVERRPVIVGPQVGRFWIITKGLKPGERVLTEGIQKVKPKMVVVPHEIPLGQISELAAAPPPAMPGDEKSTSEAK